MSLLRAADAALVLVDVQEGFRAYECFAAVAARAATLIEGARTLRVPLIVSEQYPKGLGHTVAELGLPQEQTVLEKTVFSAVRADGFDLHGAKQAIVCGIETHVCVSQTVHDLLAGGAEVHVIADAVGSRHPGDHERGLARMEQAGAVISTVEAALFELLERAGSPEFKAVQRLII